MDTVEALRKAQAEYLVEVHADTVSQTRRDLFKIGLGGQAGRQPV